MDTNRFFVRVVPVPIIFIGFCHNYRRCAYIEAASYQ